MMTRLFELSGADLDVGYTNLRAGEHRAERDIVAVLEGMWERYGQYADADFIQAFARDPEARFWEMYLGCALLDAGKELVKAADRPGVGGRPDLCVLHGQHRIWIEAIAPTRGEQSEDRIPEIIPINEGGGFRQRPVRQIQLRVTSALWTESQVIARYRREGVIAPEDVALVAIGACRFGIEAAGAGIPLALSAVFPIGDEFVRIDTESLDIVARGHDPSFEIARRNSSIPRTAFLTDDFAHIGGLIWSRVGIGNMDRGARPLSLVHNPMADKPISQGWGVWDREFVALRSGDEWTVSDILAAPHADRF